MKILFKIESTLPQFDGDQGEKETITSFTLGLNNPHELNSVLTNWKWGWGTLASDFVNLRLWIDVLNKLDECLRFIILEFGDVLLVSMIDVQSLLMPSEKTAEILEREQQCIGCLQLAKTILNWTSVMLERGILKDLYNSIEVRIKHHKRISLPRQIKLPMMFKLNIRTSIVTIDLPQSGNLFLTNRSQRLLFFSSYSKQLVNLLLGAFDDELASSALRVFVALAVSPLYHRTVFMCEHRSALHTEASLSNSLFDIVLAAGETRMSVEQILAIRKHRSADRSNDADPESAAADADGDDIKTKAREKMRDNGESNTALGYFYGVNESEAVVTTFPSRIRLHSKTDGATVAETDAEKGHNLVKHKLTQPVALSNSSVVTKISAVIENWKCITNGDLSADDRPLRDIILSDFVRIESTAESQKASNAKTGKQLAVPWAENNLCLLWRLRFLRAQRHRGSSVVQGSEEGLKGVMLFYQAVLVLNACHLNSSKISDFFSGKGGPILSDLVCILQSRHRQDSSEGLSSMPIVMNSSTEGMNAAYQIVPLCLTTVACQCLKAILGRAEEVAIESQRRRDPEGSNPMKQMPSFERIQSDLGLERGQVGGLLVELLRTEIVVLIQIDIIAVINSTATAESEVEVSAATALILQHYDRLLYVEQLLVLTMCCLPLQGALSTVIDNGILSLFQDALSVPRIKTKNLNSARSDSPNSEVKNEIRETLYVPRKVKTDLCDELNGLCGALSELRLCVDSFIAQMLDMIVDSKKRAMVIFHSQGGIHTIMERLKFEARRPPPILPVTMDDRRNMGCLPFSRQSLIFSLVSITESLLHPTRRLSLPPSTDSSILSPIDMLTSEDFSETLKEVLDKVPKGCQILMCACLSLLELLITTDPSPPKILSHFLSNGLVKSAWIASSKTGMAHEEDSLMSILDLITSLCVTEDGLKLVQSIGPFPIIFRCFHDRLLLLSETATLVSTVPEAVGKKLSELLQEYPALLPPCTAALTNEIALIAELAEARCTKRFLLEEDGDQVCVENGRASIDQGDLRVFYFAAAAVRCLDGMSDFGSKDSAMGIFLDFESGKQRGMKLLLSLVRSSVGSDSYLLTSLACRGRNSSSGEQRTYINSYPGFPPLLASLIAVHDKAWRIAPKEYTAAMAKEIEETAAKLKDMVSARTEMYEKPFKNFLDSVSPFSADLCKYTNTGYGGVGDADIDSKDQSEIDDDIKEYCSVLRSVTYLSQLIFLYTAAMKFRMSKSYAFNTNDAKKEAEADAEFDCLYGQVHASHSATKGSKKPPKKATPPVGALQAVLAVLLEGGLYLSCVQELVRMQQDALWDTGEKLGTGEDVLSFNLVVIVDRVSVKSGLGTDSRRITRLEAGCTVEAVKRVSSEVTEGKMRYCLADRDRGGSGEKWVSLFQPSVFPPLEGIDVVAVSHAAVSPDTAVCKTCGEKSFVRQDTVSLSSAGATALALLETSVQKLISLISLKICAEPVSMNQSSADAVECAGALLRPIATYVPRKVLQLVDDIVKRDICSIVKYDNCGHKVKLRGLASFSHGLRLCSYLILRKNKSDALEVKELPLMQLFQYGKHSRVNGHGNDSDSDSDCDSYNQFIYAAESDSWNGSGSNLLEALLRCTVRLFNACLPQTNTFTTPESIASTSSTAQKEAIEEECRCVAFEALVHQRGALNFWLVILQYISSNRVTPTEKALEAAYDSEDIFSSQLMKMMLCEVLMRPQHLPSIWAADRLGEYPRGVAELVCELLLESHRAVCSCVSYSAALDKAAEDKLKKKMTPDELATYEASKLIAAAASKPAAVPDPSLTADASSTDPVKHPALTPWHIESTPSGPYSSWIGDGVRVPFGAPPKSKVRLPKDPPPVQSTAYKKKITALRLLIPNIICDRLTDLIENSTDAYTTDCENSWTCYAFHFRDINEGPAWQLQVETCGTFLRLIEGECVRGRGPRDSEWGVKGVTSDIESEKDHWLWPANLVYADRHSPRPFFSLRIMELVQTATALHISPEITKAASAFRSEAKLLDVEDVGCLASKAEQSYHCAVSLVTWIMVRLGYYLDQVAADAAVLMCKKWSCAVGGLLLSLLNIFTGGAYVHQVSPAQQEGLLLLFTVHGSFKPLFASLVHAIEEQNALEARNVGSSSATPGRRTRLGGEGRLHEDAWVLTGMLLLDYVTRPFLPCRTNIAHAIRFLSVKRTALRIVDQCLLNVNLSLSKANPHSDAVDRSFIETLKAMEEVAESFYPPIRPLAGLPAHVVTYDLRTELGPRLLKVILYLLTFLPTKANAPEDTGRGPAAGTAAVSAEQTEFWLSREVEFTNEAYRVCLQLLTHTLHDFSLAPLYCSLSGLEVLLALPPIPGGPVAIVDIIHSCLDSHSALAARMMKVARVIIEKKVKPHARTQVPGVTNLRYNKVGLLWPIIAREPLIAFQAIKDVLKSMKPQTPLPEPVPVSVSPTTTPSTPPLPPTSVTPSLPPLPPSIDSTGPTTLPSSDTLKESQKDEVILSDPSAVAVACPVVAGEEGITGETVPCQEEEPFVYSDSAAVTPAHVTNLLFSRIKALCAACVGGGPGNGDGVKPSGDVSPKDREERAKMRIENEDRLTDSVHFLAELVHCSPSRSFALNLGRDSVEAPKGAEEEGISPPQSTHTESRSIVQLLIQTIMLPAPSTATVPALSTSTEAAVVMTFDQGEGDGEGEGEAQLAAFNTPCQAAVVHLLRSLLSVSFSSKQEAERESRALSAEHSAVVDIIPQRVFGAIVEAYQTLLRDIPTSTPGVTRRLKALNLLTEGTYCIFRQEHDCSFQQPDKLFDIAEPRPANSLCPVSALPLPLLQHIIETSTFAILHSDNPASNSCLKQTSKCLSYLLPMHQPVKESPFMSMELENCAQPVDPVVPSVPSTPLAGEKGDAGDQFRIELYIQSRQEKDWDGEDVDDDEDDDDEDNNEEGEQAVEGKGVVPSDSVKEKGTTDGPVAAPPATDAALEKEAVNIQATLANIRMTHAFCLKMDEEEENGHDRGFDFDDEDDDEAVAINVAIAESLKDAAKLAKETKETKDKVPSVKPGGKEEDDKDIDGNWSDVESEDGDDEGDDEGDEEEGEVVGDEDKGWEEECSVESSSMYSYLSGEEEEEEEEAEDLSDGGMEDYGGGDFGRPSWALNGRFTGFTEGIRGMRRAGAWRSSDGASADREAQSESIEEDDSEEEGSDEDYDDDSDDDDSYDTIEDGKLEAEEDFNYFECHRDVQSISDDSVGEEEEEDKGRKAGVRLSNEPRPDWGSDFPMVLHETRSPGLRAAAMSQIVSESYERDAPFRDSELSARRWGDLGTMGWKVLLSPYAALLQKHLLPGTNIPLSAAGNGSGKVSKKHCKSGVDEDLDDDSRSLSESSEESSSPSTVKSVEKVSVKADPFKGVAGQRNDGEQCEGKKEEEETVVVEDLFVKMLPNLHLALLHTPDVSKHSISTGHFAKYSQLRREFIDQHAILLDEVLCRGKKDILRVEDEALIDLFIQRVTAITAAVHCTDPVAFYSTLLGPTPANASDLELSSRAMLLERVQEPVTDRRLLRLLNACADILESSQSQACWVAAALWSRSAEQTPSLSLGEAHGEGGEGVGGKEILSPTYFDRLLLLVTHPCLDSKGRITAIHDLIRICAAAGFSPDSTSPYAGLSHPDRAPVRTKYMPCMEVSEAALKGLLYTAVHDVSNGREQTGARNLIQVVSRDRRNWPLILAHIEALAHTQMGELRDQVARISGMVETQMEIPMDSSSQSSVGAMISISPHTSPSSAPENTELRLLLLLDMALTISTSDSEDGAVDALKGTVSAAADASREERQKAVSRVVSSIASNDLWCDLDECMDSIRALEDKGSATSSGSNNNSNSNSSSNSFPPPRVRQLSTSKQPLSMQDILRKPTHILSPLSSSMVPLLECYLRAACLDQYLSGPAPSAAHHTTHEDASHGHGQGQGHNQGETDPLAPPSIPPIVPVTPLPHKHTTKTYVPTPFSFAPVVPKVAVVPTLSALTSCTYRSLRTACPNGSQLPATLPPIFEQNRNTDNHQGSRVDIDVTDSPAAVMARSTDSEASVAVAGGVTEVHATSASAPSAAVSAVSSAKSAPLESAVSATAASDRAPEDGSGGALVVAAPLSAPVSISISVSMSAQSTAPPSTHQFAAAAEHLSHFCEKNRSLLNALVRQNIRLLEGSLMPLLSSQGGRKILDFDVKRAYLKLKLRRLRRSAEKEEDENDTTGFSDDSDIDDMTIAVEIERERIIESSYNALQHVSPRRLLRGNFDIIFENEEGVDGGGLTREWYALLMREVSVLCAAIALCCASF